MASLSSVLAGHDLSNLCTEVVWDILQSFWYPTVKTVQKGSIIYQVIIIVTLKEHTTEGQATLNL